MTCGFYPDEPLPGPRPRDEVDPPDDDTQTLEGRRAIIASWAWWVPRDPLLR